MTILFNGNEFKYEMENVARLFHPLRHFQFAYEQAEVPEGDYLIFTRTLADDHADLRVDFREGDTCDTESSQVPQSRRFENDCEEEFARMLYRLLERQTGVHPRWGILTGIRPVHRMQYAMEQGKTEAEIRKLLQEAGKIALDGDDAVYAAAGYKPGPLNDSAALLNLLNAGYAQTLGTWDNLTATTANTVTREFERALDRAWLQVSSGAFDYKTAIKRAVDGLAQYMPGVTYPSGHHDTLEVAVRRAVLTGVNQTASRLQLARMAEFDWQWVEVSAHSGARPEHAAWQGKLYHRGGAVVYQGTRYEDFEAATGYGTGEGLCGWNCRHTFFASSPDNPPAWSPEELAALSEKVVPYGSKLYTWYEISQMQRNLERKVRAAKRKYMAETEAGVDATRAAVELKTRREDLKNFIIETHRRMDSSRTSVSGFGHSAAAKATAAHKRFEKSQNDAIIIEKIRAAGNLPKTAKIHLTPTPIDADSLGFDDKHINGESHHNVTKEEALQWVKNAKISATVWGGQYERYYSLEGASYVNIERHYIRTAYKKKQFDDNMQAIMEVIKEYEL